MLYTFEGGVKTIIYTDTLQTTGMLVGLVVCIIVIIKALGTDFGGAWEMMSDKGYTNIFNWDVKAGSFALKHIIGGMFIAIAMTGLDQEMMQKNISVKTLKGFAEEHYDIFCCADVGKFSFPCFRGCSLSVCKC